MFQGACLALNASKWFERVGEICAFHELPSPVHDEKLPVGTGSNPVSSVLRFVYKALRILWSIVCGRNHEIIVVIIKCLSLI